MFLIVYQNVRERQLTIYTFRPLTFCQRRCKHTEDTTAGGKMGFSLFSCIKVQNVLHVFRALT